MQTQGNPAAGTPEWLCVHRRALRSSWGPVRGRTEGADTCALCAPRESPGSGASRAVPRCTLISSPGLGARCSAARGAQRVPHSIWGMSSGRSPPPPPLTCGYGGGCCQLHPPSTLRDQPGGVEAPIQEQPAEKPCGRNFLSPLPSPSWTPEGYEGEGGKKGREGGKRGG